MEQDLDQPGWRPLVAALANPYVRRVFAQIVLGEDAERVGQELGAARRRRALATLVETGLVQEIDGRYVEQPEIFARALAAGAVPRPSGPERFLTGNGEIDRYPADAAQRRALLELVAERSLGDHEVITEAELGERLTRFHADTATLRRYLVEEEILERTRSGSQYARVRDQASAGPPGSPSPC